MPPRTGNTVTRNGVDFPFGDDTIVETIEGRETKELSGLAHAAAISNASIGTRHNSTKTAPTVVSYDFDSNLLEGTGAPEDLIYVQVDGGSSVGPAIVADDSTWSLTTELAGGEALVPRAVNASGGVTAGPAFNVAEE